MSGPGGAPAIVVFAGGVGGARFTRGLRHHLREHWPDGTGGTRARLTVVANTGDDLWLAGLRVCPDLDSLMYTLAGVADEERGWGRREESDRVGAELAAYGVGWPWFTLGDLDIGTHLARSAWLREGVPLSEATRRLCARWELDVTLLPATDDEVETHVVVGDGDELHFEEWWVRHRAALPALGFVQRGAERARPAAGVLDAIAAADVVLLAPSNPVVSIGTILGFGEAVPGIPGLRDAVRAASAPVVGLSPVIGGTVVRGMADACLTAVGVETDAHAVARSYGARAAGGLLDGWLVDDADAAGTAPGLRVAARPLRFTSVEETAAIAADALDLAGAG